MPGFIQIELDTLTDYFVKLAILCISQRHVDSLGEHLLQCRDKRWQNSGFYVLSLEHEPKGFFCLGLRNNVVCAPGKHSKVARCRFVECILNTPPHVSVIYSDASIHLWVVVAGSVGGK